MTVLRKIKYAFLRNAAANHIFGSRTMTEISQAEIATRYVNPGEPFAFTSPGAVYRHFNGEIPISTIEKALQSVHEYSSFKEYKQPRQYNVFYSLQRRKRFQADLIEMIPLKNANRGFSYLLVLIDVFSRKVWVMPLKRKGSSEMASAFGAWLQELGRDEMATHSKRFLFTDRGLEFTNRAVGNLLREANFQHDFSKRGLNKAAVAERVNKTLQTRLYKAMAFTGRSNYIDFLPEIVGAYNDSKHRTLEYMSPNAADLPENEERVREIHGRRYAKKWESVRKSREIRKLKVGDMVLIKIPGGAKIGKASRAYTPYFSDEFHEVTAVRRRMPVPMYRVSSLLTGRAVPGSFYANELSKVNPRKFKVAKRGGYVRRREGEDGQVQRLVRFEGLHPAFDTWIDAEDVDGQRRVPANLLRLAPTLQNLELAQGEEV